MKNLSVKILILMCLSVMCVCMPADAGVRKSDKHKPQWVSRLPKPGNGSYVFKMVCVDYASSLEAARMSSLKELSKMIEHEEHVKVVEGYDYNSEQAAHNGRNIYGNETEIYSMNIESEGEVVSLIYKKIDEYWEEKYEYGQSRVKLYTLYAVGHRGGTPQFDNVSYSYYYGMSALARSLVPGWGQIYKGSTGKGAVILAGEVACVAGVVVGENLRTSYIKKMKEQPKFAAKYNSKANNWATIRNYCIGAAAALYVYNLIDAVATKGAKRIKIDKNRTVGFSMSPVVFDNGIGMGMALNF